MNLESLLFRQSYSVASRARIAIYRGLGMRIGPECRLESIRIRRPRQIDLGPGNALSEGCWLWPIDAGHDGIRIRIGKQNYFNRDCMIDACGYIEIGDHNMFGPGAYLADSNHTMQQNAWVAEGPMDVGTVSIGNGCWIGTRAVILKNVVLGDHCVVAAGAVVTKSFGPRSVVAGVPARLIKVVSNE